MWYISYIIGAIVVMLSVNVRLACWVLTIVPVLAVVSMFFQKKLIEINRKIRETNSHITSNFNE